MKKALLPNSKVAELFIYYTVLFLLSLQSNYKVSMWHNSQPQSLYVNKQSSEKIKI